MLKDRIKHYFIDCDYNCAETTLRAINDEYGLDLQEEDFKLVGAWGAGAGCGITCGALAGALAAIGKLKIKGRAHATEGFPALCGEYVDCFRRGFQGCTDCNDIRPVYRREDVRCLPAVEKAAEVFEQFAAEHSMEKIK